VLQQTVNCVGRRVNCRIEKLFVCWQNYEQRERDNSKYQQRPDEPRRGSPHKPGADSTGRTN
jgi:hypothetical protein